jgi:outer membrane immunogenic protein
MRSLLRGIAALVVTTSAASAADLGVAPAPVTAPPSWTGLYIGVHAGAAWQNFTSGSIDDPNGLLASGSRTGGSALGGVGGLQAGYNWQFAPAWVVGVEGDISWTSLSDQRGGAPALGPNGLPAGAGLMPTLSGWRARAPSLGSRVGSTTRCFT